MALTLTVQPEFAYVIFVIIASLIQLTIFGFKVGSLRKRLKVSYPSVSGPPEFERAMRVHYNAIEGYPIFILLLLFGALYNPLIAAGAGVVYIIGRFIYAIGYWQAVEKRGPGAGIFHIAELVLLGCTIMFALQVLRS